jgi:hypothetical protein
MGVLDLVHLDWKSESGLMSGALRHSRIRSMLSCSS